MKNILALILSVVLIAGSSAVFFLDKIETGFRRIFSEIIPPSEKPIGELAEELVREVFAPEPLRSNTRAEIAVLSPSLIVKETNAARANEGFGALSENPLLKTAAQEKLADMIAKNYFAHVSPAGAGPDAWVKGAGYRYILIGENLAMGGFRDEADLVGAWMASPGHRSNILNPKYRDIGVAARIGTIEGERALIAIQEFGMPMSVCPEPDAELKKTITEYQDQLKTMKTALDALKTQIDSAKKSENKEEEKRLVSEYNDLVSEYNGLIARVKERIEEYNKGVREFNSCAVNSQ